MNSIHGLLTTLFAFIGFVYGEDNTIGGSWGYNSIRQSPKANYTAYEIIVTSRFETVEDFMNYMNPAFKAKLQKNGFEILEVYYVDNGKTADIRLYTEIDSELN